MKLKSLCLLVTLIFVCTQLKAQTAFTVINTNDSGAGSLRQAILDANGTAGADTIKFDIPGTGPHTISPASALPQIDESVVIRGYTQSGASVATAGTPATIMIELDGTNAGNDSHGLIFNADNCIAIGLAINRFGRAGILIIADNCTVQGCYIGTDSSGTLALGNGFRSTDPFFYDGIWINDSSINLIGGTDPATRNILSANAGAGVFINGPVGSQNRVRGNYIGTNAAGIAGLGNDLDGVSIADSKKNLIGGGAAGAGNVISGNGISGIGIDGFTAGLADSNIVQGNYIGLDVNGTQALGNGANGVGTFNTSYNLVGGTGPGAGNVISANAGTGVRFAREPGGLPATGNVVQGNYIGTDASGAFAFGNQFDGVSLSNSSNNLIGGASEAARNVIADHGFAGVFLAGAETTNNTVQGNYIGIDASGTGLLPNSDSGIDIFLAENNLIGGTEEGAGNLIAGNEEAGVSVRLSSTSSSMTARKTLVSETFKNTRISGKRNKGKGSRVKARTFAQKNIRFFFASMGSGNDREVSESQTGSWQDISIEAVSRAPGNGNAIRRNSMFDNVKLGIELDSVPRGNDSGDSDSGENKGQNYPEIQMATGNGVGLSVDYLVSSSATNSAYPLEVEFFMASTDDEGEVYLGTDTYSNANTTKTATINPDIKLNNGDKIVATATDAGGNTSEFSDTFAITGTVSVEELTGGLPQKFALEQNYPNPFNPTTTVRYSLTNQSDVLLKIYDMLGKLVRTLVQKNQTAGEYSAVWDGKSDSGRRVASGHYFYELQTGEFQSTKHMILLK